MKCTGFTCFDVPLIWLDRGQHVQTQNAFLIAIVDGWYCPKCAAGY